MLDLQKYVNECKKELDVIGVRYGKIINFKINTRAQRRFGLCKRIQGGYLIEISNKLLKDESLISELKDTIIHELIHSCDGCMNHGAKWQRIVSKVNRTYDYNIKPASSPDDEKAMKVMNIKESKYKIACCGCGKEFFRMRESEFVRHPENWQCAICGKTLKRIY